MPTFVPFAAVNRRGDPQHREGWHRHHIYPLSLRHHSRLGAFLGALRGAGFSLDDFESNGMLLPALDSIARKAAQPLHAGPHPRYNRYVVERLEMLRCACERVRTVSRREALALLGLQTLQLTLRAVIGSYGYGSIDGIVLAGSTDGDLDHAVKGILAHEPIADADKKSAAREPHFP